MITEKKLRRLEKALLKTLLLYPLLRESDRFSVYKGERTLFGQRVEDSQIKKCESTFWSVSVTAQVVL